MVLPRLVLSNFTARRARAVLTVVAIGLSVSLVVAVTTGYSSVEAAALMYLNRYMGGTDAQITRPQSISDGPVPERLVAELAKDPDVRRVTGRLEMLSEMLDKDGKRVEKATFHVIGIRRPEDTRVESLNLESGKWFDASTGNVAVADQVAAEAMKVGLGDTFSMGSESGRLKLRLVGIVHKPEILASASKTVYVPLETLQKFQKVDAGDPQVSRVQIDLKGSTDYDAFVARWTTRLKDLDAQDAKKSASTLVPMKLRMVRENRGEMDTDLKGIHVLSYLGGAVSMLAATFIVFSSLSMGVTERQRTLAMLRAVGATRRQVAGLVVIEGFLLSVAGVALGVPLGLFWVKLLQWLFDDVFSAGVVPSAGGVLFAAGGSIVAALAASLLPAWSASRVSPLEAMNPLADAPPGGAPIRWAAVGLVMVAVDPLVFFGPWEKVAAHLRPGSDPEALANLFRFYAHFAIGLECVFVGFFLMAPLFVWLIERLLATALGRVFRLPENLLRQQLSHGLWRAAGTGAALMVGLAVLIAMTFQADSMLGGWKLPDKFPDIFLVSLKFGGLNPDETAQFADIPGIRRFPDGAPELMPVAVTVSGLGNNPLALVGAAMAPNMNSTMFFGVPPRTAFRMMQLDFRDDNGAVVPRDQQDQYARRAEDALTQGRAVIVTEDYRRLNHVKYGGKINLFSETKKYEYTVAGIVWSPGLDVIVGMFDMGRQFDQRTSGMVFGSLDDARRDFGANSVSLFAANLEGGVDKTQMLKDVRKHLGELNMKAGDVRQIKFAIDTGFRRLLALVSTVAFAALAVASLGVTNTVMASIRTRRWQFGVLRSIGLARGDLLRLVLAEAFLLGVVGMVLGLACGIVLSIDARQLSADVLGYLPPLSIPWGYILVGATSVLAVAVLASVGPAIAVSRTEPLSLLQAGRAAA